MSSVELTEKRQENSKRYKLGGRKEQLVISMGAIHYKNNYANKRERWKDIDLTWEGNKITKAPYILTRDKKLYTITNKKTGEITTIEVLSNNPDFNLIPDFTQIKFQHMTTFTPFEAKFRITGRGRFVYRAYDDEGELVLDASLVSGILTEKLSFVKDKYTQEIRLVKGNIRIDPTWQVTESTDDCDIRYTDPAFSLTSVSFRAGYQASTLADWGSAAKFLNVNIPAGEIITLANLILTARANSVQVTVNSRLRAELNVNPATFSDITDFNARTWTTELRRWDEIGTWTMDVEYTSPDFAAVVQEVADLGAITHLVILWDDFEKLSDQVNEHYRSAYSQNGSAEFAPKLVITVAVRASYLRGGGWFALHR